MTRFFAAAAFVVAFACSGAFASEPGQPINESDVTAVLLENIQNIHVLGAAEGRAVKITNKNFFVTDPATSPAVAMRVAALVEEELKRKGFNVVGAPSEADAVLRIEMESRRSGWSRNISSDGMPLDSVATETYSQVALLWIHRPSPDGVGELLWEGMTVRKHNPVFRWTLETFLRGVAKDAAQVIRSACDEWKTPAPVE